MLRAAEKTGGAFVHENCVKSIRTTNVRGTGDSTS